MRIFLSVMMLAVAAPWGGAVETASGKLDALIGNDAATATELTLSGTMDARDFKFIAESMPGLSTLDLGEVTIEEYSDKEPLFANFTYYPANELPKYSLMGTSIRSVVLPSTLTSIGEASFAGCTELSEITVPSTVTEIGNYAFSGDVKLTAVKGCENVTKVGEYAFSHDGELASVAAMPKLENVGGYAFLDSKRLASFTFAATVQTIGEGAFSGSGLTAVDMSGSPRLNVIGAWAFADNSSLKEVKLPQTVAAIGDGAFFYSTSLQSIRVPSGVTKINDFAFMGGKAMATVELPEGLKEIGDYAFSDWQNVKKILVPSTVEYIGERAMRNWDSLEELTSEAPAPPALGDDVWENVDPEGVELRVPEASVPAYHDAEQWKEFFKSSSAQQLSPSGIRVTVSGDVVTIISDSCITLAQLFDMSGIVLASVRPDTAQTAFNLSGFSGRTYVVRCVAGGKEQIIKISR